MKLSVLLLIVTMLQVSASSFAQRITLQQKNAELKDVLAKIRKQTGYDFIFSTSTFKDAKKVNIDVRDADLELVLTKIFKDQPLQFKINDNKSVVITKKDKSVLDTIIDYFSTIDVRGKVLDEQGQPLIGATVKVKGGSIGTMTDKEGEFFLKGVPEDAIVVIAYLGYKPLELKAVASMGVIKMELNQEELQEVVINKGYYETTRELNTGSVGRVNANVIEKQPVLNPLAAIQGRVTGAYVQQTTGTPGGDFKIEIRGKNSLRADGNEPLYVIDGVPFSSEKVSGIAASGILESGANPLVGINNADIESIEILKDADASAIYGSRGANGVILITTKKGRHGKTKLGMDIYTGMAFAPQVKLVNTQQYLALRHEAFANDGLTPSDNPQDLGQNGKGYSPDLTIWDTTRYTDWQKTLIGNPAHSTSIQASLTGGNESTQFLLSTGYRKEATVLPADFAFTKTSSHFTLNHLSPDKKLTLILSLTGAADRNINTSADFVNRSRVYAPNAPAIYNIDGSYNWENSTWENPMPALRDTRYTGKTHILVANAILGYEIITGLKIKSSFGLTQLYSKERTLNPSTIFDPAHGETSERSNVIDASGTNSSWIIEPQIGYEKRIGLGFLSILAGVSFQEQQLERKADYYKDFPSNSLLNNLVSANEKTAKEFITSRYRYAAVFGRMNYDIEKKYILNITGRRDGSSRFGLGRQFANFGAVGVAWIFSREKWMPGISLLSYGKVRASYGITGSDQIGNYKYLDTYIAADARNNISQYDGIIGLNPSRLFNPAYGWEVNRKLEAAIELGLLKDCIDVSAAFYSNRSSNQLIDYTLPVTTGFGSILSNFPAIIQNMGIEFELNTTNIKKRHFKWSSSFNITVPNNKLMSFPNIKSSTYANTYIVGKSIYIKTFYEYSGVDPLTGLNTFKDYNGDGKLTRPEDAKFVILINQEFYGGLNNSIKYRNWSLDVFFQYVKQKGQDYLGGIPGLAFSLPVAFLDKKRWQKPGDIAEVQKLMTEYNPAANGGLVTDYLLQSNASISDASFIRCKNVSLAYQLPEKWVKSVSGRIYIQGQNLFVITKYKSFDPESQAVRLAPLKVLTAGIQFDF